MQNRPTFGRYTGSFYRQEDSLPASGRHASINPIYNQSVSQSTSKNLSASLTVESSDMTGRKSRPTPARSKLHGFESVSSSKLSGDLSKVWNYDEKTNNSQVVTNTMMLHKVSRVRWRPQSHLVAEEACKFVVGTWDSHPNRLMVWASVAKDGAAAEIHGTKEHRMLCEAPHLGDVQDVLYLENDLVLTSSSTGSLSMYKHVDDDKIHEVKSWPALHYHQNKVNVCASTALAAHAAAGIFVSGGEDGRLNILNLERQEVMRCIEHADSNTINAIKFTGQSTVATVNSSGQVKVWDIREGGDSRPSSCYSVVGSRAGFQCIAMHPGQKHILATGADDGIFYIWDLRETKANKFSSYVNCPTEASIMEAKFYPSKPQVLFACTEDGGAWVLDASELQSFTKNSVMEPTYLGGNPAQRVDNPWLGSAGGRQPVISPLYTRSHRLSVNTLDIESNTLLCGTDAGEITTFHIPSLPEVTK